jgi:endoglucanase
MKPGCLSAVMALLGLAVQAVPPGAASKLVDGAIVRGSPEARQLALVFTGHQFAEGSQIILDQLASHHARGSFFLTGDFLRNTNFTSTIRRIITEGHYLGPHSDHHLLYCSWEKPFQVLVSQEQFRADLEANLREIQNLGVPRSRVQYFLPPFEHYNRQIAEWTSAAGLALINFTPGTRSNADYTGESEPNFVSSKKIFDSIMARESEPGGLNGFLLLLHLGAGPQRQDKFHARFGELLDRLAEKNYRFVRVDELLN